MAAARVSVSEAYQIWHELDLPLWKAPALWRLGDLHDAAGDHSAVAAWSQAHAPIQRLDVPEADEVARKLIRGATARRQC